MMDVVLDYLIYAGTLAVISLTMTTILYLIIQLLKLVGLSPTPKDY